MICPHCQASIEPGQTFCKGCGHPVEHGKKLQAPESVFDRVAGKLERELAGSGPKLSPAGPRTGERDRALSAAEAQREREQREWFERQPRATPPVPGLAKKPDWGIPPDAVPPPGPPARGDQPPPEPPHPAPSPPPYDDPAHLGKAGRGRSGVGYAPGPYDDPAHSAASRPGGYMPPDEPIHPGPTNPTLARATASEVSIDGKPLGILNLLLLHAGISPFRHLEVKTSSRDGLAGCRLRVSVSPPVAAPAVVDLPRDSQGGAVEPPALTPDYEAFYALDEAKRGQIDLALLYENHSLAERTFLVTIQNPNEWISLEGIEASLAGIVTPSAPAVVDVLSSLPGDFEGYQRNSRERVIEQAEAVYEGIRRLGLAYNGIPPSFEGTGQKVLFPDELLARRKGCCIDIATLTAALLESISLHPVIVAVNGHAFSGVYTELMHARTPVLRDANVVLELIEEGSLLVWNSTTYFDRQGDDSFTAAIEMGRQYLGAFRYILDIAACRKHGYKPVTRRSA